jgi:prepilin-type N-terminal cleavage/methylation domain-containing protein
MKKLQKGFTLIELLVVIAIIGILSSVVLASLNSARSKGNDTAVKSNLLNARTQAELFYDGTTGYTGVCAIGASGSNTIGNQVKAAAAASGLTYTGTANTVASSATVPVCHDSTGAWAAIVPLRATGAGSFCVDSEGVGATTTATKLASGVYKCS